MNAASGPRRRESLDRRLPLLITGLLIVIVSALGLIAYREVRQTSSLATATQLGTVVKQAVENSARTTAARLEALTRIAADTSVVAALTHPESLTRVNAARAFLLERRTPTDTATLLSQHLLAANGQTLDVGDAPPSTLGVSMLAEATDSSRAKRSAVVGRFYNVEGEVRYWVVIPSIQAGTLHGFVAERRRVRNTRAANQQLSAIAGQPFSVWFTNVDRSLWVGTDGVSSTAPFEMGSDTSSFRVDDGQGDKVLGVHANVRGTPWIIVLTANESDVFARANSFLRRMLWIAVLLLTVGALGARWVTRQVTRPLHALTDATRRIAAGDFSTRAHVRGRDELGELARAFNWMAEQIGLSHDQLGLRIQESERLSQELRERNHDLQLAQQWATEASEASEQAREEAQRASSAKSEFLAMMSHELRTPLSAIAGYAEILLLGLRGDLNPSMRLDIARIQANQQHLLRIINDILDLTQVESGKVGVDLQPVPLRAVLHDLDSIICPIVEEREIEYSVSDHALHVTIVADRERLLQVLVNLVANAARFTERKGRVAIHTEQDNGRARIHVTDSGIGITADQMERVFEPFVQVESGSARSAQGTGLGLAISRRLVEAMNGSLTLESRVGVGSTFTIDLPAAREQLLSSATVSSVTNHA